MAGLTPLPTHVHHETARLTHRDAHTLLSDFLERAENNAAYRPDSTLTERGPQSSSAGSNPNLTLHHLKRILSGIEGRRVGGEDINRFFTGLDSSQQRQKRRYEGVDSGFGSGEATPTRRKRQHRVVFDDSNGAAGVAVGEESEGWQDKDDYELAQDDQGVDVAAVERHPGAELEQPHDKADEEAMVEIEIVDTGEKIDPRSDGMRSREKQPVSKEERKRLKKQRSKAEGSERAKKRQERSP